ncbi:MAG TPA: type II toxin-antitoxin system VapC family toxin [Candidatus Saccharimonadales bacterium]|jgi:PIN domain nuclease of toxin-antitoxin system|nr:type II toxin-antitoxin system VapC family toxin [Candidatus Saccharimonadales bacterium]
MKYLLDTSIFLWSLDAFHNLNQEAQELLTTGAGEIYLSSVSSWEIAIKWGIGKLKLPGPPGSLIPSALSNLSIRTLPMTHSHAFAVADLPPHHSDPFDRMLIAQARSEDMVLLTSDRAFEKYKIKMLWCGRA